MALLNNKFNHIVKNFNEGLMRKNYFAAFIFLSVTTNVYAVNEVPVFATPKIVISEGKYMVILGPITYIDGGSWGWVSSGRRQVALGAYGPPIGGGTPGFYYFPPGMTTAKSETNSQVAKRWAGYSQTVSQANGPLAGVASWGTPDLLRSCFGFVIYQTGNSQIASLAPGACNYAAPIPGQCNITTPEIILDHKTILKDKIDLSVAENTFNVNCVRSFTAKFSLGGGQKALSIGGGTSTIKINDKPLLSNIALADGDNSMKISSTLSNVEPGTWQQSTVLTMEFF